MNRFNHYLPVFALICSLFSVQQSQAQSSLLITTPRVVFEGRMRSASVHLKNAGDSRGNYRVFFHERTMNTNGNVTAIKGDGVPAWSATKMIRYSPRRVSLAALQNQRIRLALRKPATLPDGEYRSHLVFRSAPEVQTDAEGEKLTTAFRPTFEFSIPIIIRHGKTFATASLSSPVLTQAGKQQKLSLTLNRTGNRSLYGDFQLLGLTGPDDSGTPLFEQKGLAHYTPLTARKVNLLLPENINLRPYSHLKVIFQERPKYGGNERAELVFTP